MSSNEGKQTLAYHLQQVKKGDRRFENAFQSISRMILGRENAFEKINVNGELVNDFGFFRENKKPIVGMHSTISDLVGFIKDGADGGDAKERALALVGEPGNGKTNLVNYLCKGYREFISLPENNRFIFRFKNLSKIETYEMMDTIESQTFEDPMILAMNLGENNELSKELLAKIGGFGDEQIRTFFENYRPLGACSKFIFNQIKELTDGNLDEIMKNFIEIVPGSTDKGFLTTTYPPESKITASTKDLVGDQSVQRLMYLKNCSGNPYLYDLREGLLARSAGGGIHFPDEFFKKRKDILFTYLGTIQDREISLKGHSWPIDTFMIGTSNIDEFSDFKQQKGESPIINRTDVLYVEHITNYKFQDSLTNSIIGKVGRLTTLGGKPMHVDPNTRYVFNVASVLTRLPKSDKLTPEEMMNLAAGDVAGEKSVKTLTELIDELATNPDVSKRFGQTGLNYRDLGRVKTALASSYKTNQGKCLFAGDVFSKLEKEVLNTVSEEGPRTNSLNCIKIAERLYLKEVKREIFNAYMDNPDAIENEVRNYVNMVVGMDADNLGKDKMWPYKDPQTGEVTAIKIDENWVTAVEVRMGLKTKEQIKSFRSTIMKTYGQRLSTDPTYNFMDNTPLVEAITETRFESDVGTESSLVGALANRGNDDNDKIHTRLMGTMKGKLGYCDTCAKKTIQYFAEHSKSDKA